MTCPICLEETIEKDNTDRLSCCGNDIHKQCYLGMLEAGYMDCPLCRNKLNVHFIISHHMPECRARMCLMCLRLVCVGFLTTPLIFWIVRECIDFVS